MCTCSQPCISLTFRFGLVECSPHVPHIGWESGELTAIFRKRSPLLSRWQRAAAPTSRQENLASGAFGYSWSLWQSGPPLSCLRLHSLAVDMPQSSQCPQAEVERELQGGPDRTRIKRSPVPPSRKLQQGGELCAKLWKVHIAWPLASLSLSLLPLERDPVQAHMLVLRVKLEA